MKTLLTTLSLAGALFASNSETNFKEAESDLNNSKPKLIKPATMGSTSSSTPSSGNMMTTSKLHKQPTLMTIHTAEIIEAYGLGFSGSGNIHKTLSNATKNPLGGSIVLGLGGISELGYSLADVYTTNEMQRNAQGHFKIQLKEEGSLPATSIYFGSTINNSFEDENANSYKLDRNVYNLMFSQSFNAGKYNIGTHLSLQYLQDEFSFQASNADDKQVSSGHFAPQLGITWQSKKDYAFMTEFKMVHLLNNTDLAISGLTENIEYTEAYEANIGARYFFRNWIFMDAGVKTLYNKETKDINSEIHANLTGVIPLNSLYHRVLNLVD
jgi:hypothetical protein